MPCPLGFTDDFHINIVAADSNLTVNDAATFALTLLETDTIAGMTETVKFGFSGTEFADTVATPSEGRSFAIRVWASGCTDNDASKTTPANANGQNDTVHAVVKTNNSLGDLTNPVVLSSAAFAAVPSSGTWTTKFIRLYFNIPSRTTALDTIQFVYNIGAGDVAVYTHSGTAAVNHGSGDFTFDVSALTLAQLQNMVIKASYTAVIVAAPETQINLDAMAIELVGTL